MSNFSEVWEGTQSLVDRIRVRSGLSTTEEFSQRYGQPARLVAQLCMFSPYSPSFSREKMGELKLLPFSHAKGSFQRSIMHAQAAVQSCDGRYFGQNLSSSERRRVEPEYKYAAFIVALFGSFETSFSHFSTLNEHGEEWSPFRSEETAYAFLQRTQSRTFSHRLRTSPLMIAPGSIVTRYLERRWFADFTDQVLTDMYTALAAKPIAEKNEPVLLEVIRITAKAVDAQK
ncbi:MAG: TraI domain-containing protein, partial [Burkholderiales bacterium]|nr:TraI domain-containing protein [Burkholderiales bacterium]